MIKRFLHVSVLNEIRFLRQRYVISLLFWRTFGDCYCLVFSCVCFVLSVFIFLLWYTIYLYTYISAIYFFLLTSIRHPPPPLFYKRSPTEPIATRSNRSFVIFLKPATSTVWSCVRLELAGRDTKYKPNKMKCVRGNRTPRKL